MFSTRLLLLALTVVAVSCEYYACPEDSLCVDRNFCSAEDVSYDVMERESDSAYVCGAVLPCQDHVCCSQPSNITDDYRPTMEEWCYPYDAENTIEGGDSIVPYPGWMAEDHEIQMIKKNLSMCASNYICVPHKACSEEILMENQAFCGAESADWVCCPQSMISEDPEEMIAKMDKAPAPTILNVLIKFIQSKFGAGSDDMEDAEEMEGEEELIPASETIESSFRTIEEPEIVPASAEYPEVIIESADRLEHIEPRAAGQALDWVCGRTLQISQQLQRIHAPVGNHDASEGDYPWHVAITDQQNTFLCSGVIVGDRTVLTVAHCVNKLSASDLLVRVGEVNLREKSEKYPSKDILVSSLKIHPDYDNSELTFDIAVLKLALSVRNVPNVRPACLPDKFTPDLGKCQVPGWGQYSRSKQEVKEFSFVLRKARFYVVTREQCERQLRKVPAIGSFFKLQKTSICAEGYTSADTCKGDGGSGLVCRAGETFVLKGLVSWGMGCGQNLPGVYTDVSQFLDFIRRFEAEEFQTRPVAALHDGKPALQEGTLYREEYLHADQSKEQKNQFVNHDHGGNSPSSHQQGSIKINVPIVQDSYNPEPQTLFDQYDSQPGDVHRYDSSNINSNIYADEPANLEYHYGDHKENIYNEESVNKHLNDPQHVNQNSFSSLPINTHPYDQEPPYTSQFGDVPEMAYPNVVYGNDVNPGYSEESSDYSELPKDTYPQQYYEPHAETKPIKSYPVENPGTSYSFDSQPTQIAGSSNPTLYDSEIPNSYPTSITDEYLGYGDVPAQSRLPYKDYDFYNPDREGHSYQPSGESNRIPSSNDFYKQPSGVKSGLQQNFYDGEDPYNNPDEYGSSPPRDYYYDAPLDKSYNDPYVSSDPGNLSPNQEPKRNFVVYAKPFENPRQREEEIYGRSSVRDEDGSLVPEPTNAEIDGTVRSKLLKDRTSKGLSEFAPFRTIVKVVGQSSDEELSPVDKLKI